MSAVLITGKPVVEAILAPLEQEQRESTLAVVQVGGRKESNSYVTQLTQTANRITQMTLEHHALDESASPEVLKAEMDELNQRPEIGGYMLQLPLPPHLQLRLQEVRDWIDPTKDIDVLGHGQRGIFLSEKRKGQILPPTPYAVMKMLQYHEVDVRGKIVTIVGDGMVGGMLKIMLGNDKATQIVCNETTQNLELMTRMGDVVVGASGVPNLITGDMVKKGAVVVNVGMKFNAGTGKMDGDVDVESVMERASMVTPIKGGTGPVTVAALVQNLFRAVRMVSA